MVEGVCSSNAGWAVQTMQFWDIGTCHGGWAVKFTVHAVKPTVQNVTV